MQPSDILQRIEHLPLSGKTVLIDAFVGDDAAAAELALGLRSLVGADGTLVVPAFTDDRTLAGAVATPVAFHAELAADARRGALPDAFRRRPGSLRSSHPTNSFLASGPRAQVLLSTNRDNNPLGPVKKLNLMNGYSLRIDQPAGLYTPLHLAESQSLPNLRYRGTAKRLNLAGFEERVVIEHVATCTEGFAAVDEHLVAEDLAPREGVALVRLRDLVRAAAVAIASAPERLLCGQSDCASCAVRRAAIAADHQSS